MVFFGLDTSTSDKQQFLNVRSPKKTQIREIFKKKRGYILEESVHLIKQTRKPRKKIQYYFKIKTRRVHKIQKRVH